METNYIDSSDDGGIYLQPIFLSRRKFDGLVKSLKRRIPVIPANPGSGPGQAPESSYFKFLKILWTPVSTGVTTFYENIKIDHFHFSIFLFTNPENLCPPHPSPPPRLDTVS